MMNSGDHENAILGEYVLITYPLIDCGLRGSKHRILGSISHLELIEDIYFEFKR